MTTTDRVSKILNQEPVSEGKFSGNGEGYLAFNDAGVECEVGEFLYGMVRILKPQFVMETGTHRGISTLYLALAMADNGFGTIDTIEFIPEHYEYSNQLFRSSSEISKHINNIRGDATKWQPESGRRYQMALLDTEPQLRFAEFVRYFDYFTEGGYIFIHDLHRHLGQVENKEHGFAWPWGRLPGNMKRRMEEGQVRPFYFSTPRGLSGFYKVSPEDFK